MLRQILQDMYVDPEILSGLDEYQKQTLFCKMREEQIRRWRIREKQNDSRPTTLKKSMPNKKNKNVTFREDEEGEPWVFVIEAAIYTDNSDSEDSDNNVKKNGYEETKQRARELAEIETKELRLQYKAELTEIINDYDTNRNKNSNCKKDKSISDDPLGSPIIDDKEVYCSVDELRERMNQSKLISVTNYAAPISCTKTNHIINFSFSNSMDNQNERNVILSDNKKVSAKIALWEQRVIREKTNEIYQRLKKKQKQAAEIEAKQQEEAWKEQERKAKVADIQYREIARRAREEHRKSLNSETKTAVDTVNNNTTANNSLTNGNESMSPLSSTMTTPTIKTTNHVTKGPAPQPPKFQPTFQQSSSPPSSLDALIPRPSSYEAMIQWYHNVEINKGSGLESIESRLPCKWFYGLMSRIDAEQLLESEPMGTFLVRLSEKIWGYAISYKDIDRCKHYLVNAATGQYKFLGANQVSHDNLSKYFLVFPIYENILLTLLETLF